jgi:hypothetical protein
MCEHPRKYVISGNIVKKLLLVRSGVTTVVKRRVAGDLMLVDMEV